MAIASLLFGKSKTFNSEFPPKRRVEFSRVKMFKLNSEKKRQLLELKTCLII